LFGSKYAITLVLVSNSFIALKNLSCSSPQQNGRSFLVNTRSGTETSLKFGMNLAQYVAIPKRLHTTLVVVDGKALVIDLTLVGSGKIPSLETTNPKR